MKFLIFILLIANFTFAQDYKLVGDKLNIDFSKLSWFQGENANNIDKSKVFIVEFWGTKCGPCVDAIPKMNKLYSELPADVALITIARESGDKQQQLKTLEEFMEAQEVVPEYPISIDPTDALYNNMMAETASFGVPTYFIVDSNGVLLDTDHPAATDFLKRLEEIKTGEWNIEKARGIHQAQQAESIAWANAYKESQEINKKLQELQAEKKYQQAHEYIEAKVEGNKELANIVMKERITAAALAKKTEKIKEIIDPMVELYKDYPAINNKILTLLNDQSLGLSTTEIASLGKKAAEYVLLKPDAEIDTKAAQKILADNSDCPDGVCELPRDYKLSEDLMAERERMLSGLKNTSKSKLSFPNYFTASDQNRKLLTFYRRHLYPIYSEMEALSRVRGVYSIMIDRALFLNEDEKKAWMEAKDAAYDKYLKLANSEEYLNNKKELIRLNRGTPVTNFTQALYKMEENFEKNKLSDAQQEMSKAISKETQNIQNVLAESPYVKDMRAYSKTAQEVMSDFFAGKITYQDGIKQLDKAAKGYDKHVEFYTTKAEKNFNNLAIQKTKLAQSKGFKNYAEQAIDSQKKGYQGELVELKTRKQFLRNFLHDTKDVYKKYLEARYLAVTGEKLEVLPKGMGSFLPPQTSGLIDEYLPKENIVDIWREAMVESGFDKKVVDGVTVDAYPRDRKYYHAYMTTTSESSAKKQEIDARELKALRNNNHENWNPAEVYIVQNFSNDGPRPAETAFHEGGHALDFIHQRPMFEDKSTYAYVETHSMTMEYFLEDLDFLLAKAVNKKGEKIPKDLAVKYLNNKKLKMLSQMRRMARNSLFEIELWDYEFTDKSLSFYERAIEVGKNLDKEFETVKSAGKATKLDYLSRFGTIHHWGRPIRYIGYFLAQVAADMNAKFMWDKLEKETGRRTFLKQPSMAKMLIDGYYRTGFEKPFPLSVEEFTGQSFSFERFIEQQEKLINGHIKSIGCDGQYK